MTTIQERSALLEKLFQALIQSRRNELVPLVAQQTGGLVCSGPFHGMKLIHETSWRDGDLLPKLLGIYEQELHTAINQFAKKKYTAIVNIGCAEGYYAVGLSRLFPDLPTFAFDIDEAARNVCALAAKANARENFVFTGGMFKPEDFVEITRRHKDILCIVDCEGYEEELFQDHLIAGCLDTSDFLIECHGFPATSVASTLQARFEATHHVTLLTSAGRNPSSFRFLDHVSDLDRWLAVNEGRPHVMGWLIAEAKRSQKNSPELFKSEPPNCEEAKVDEEYFRHSGGGKHNAIVTGEAHMSPRQTSHFIYCDASLINNKGHYANSCRHIVGEARRRGIETTVLGSKHIESVLAQEIGVRPHFNLPGWALTSSDPLCGWLESSFALTESTRQDLEGIQGLNSSDVLYWNSSNPGELQALVDWMQAKFTADNCPRVAVEFGYPPGLTRTTDENGNPRLNLTNQQPHLFRFAIRRLKPEYHKKLVLGTFDAESSRDYTDMLAFPVQVFPLPQRIEAAPRLRSLDRPMIVSFLGHQRPDKGFGLLEALIPQILQNNSAVRIMVHNGAEAEMVEETKKLIAMADNEPRLGVHHGPADGQLWGKLLDLSSLIVLPYQPERYMNAYSAILAEAFARGIPLVVPQGTTLARMVKEYANCGTTFSEWTTSSVFAAINEALADFEFLSKRALEASRIWKGQHGPDKTLNFILGAPVQQAKQTPSEVPKGAEVQTNGFVALDTLLRSAGNKSADATSAKQKSENRTPVPVE